MAKEQLESIRTLASAGEPGEARDRLEAIEGQLPPGDAEVAKATAETEKTIEKTAEATCGKEEKGFKICFYIGAFAASGSLTSTSMGEFHGGKTSRTLVSTAIPTMGLRVPIDRKARFSFEAGLLTMLVSKDLATTDQRNGCRKDTRGFERRLPCEGNVSMSPVVGLYAGVTAGTEDIGLVTLMPMVGLANTSLDKGIRPYVGLAVGLVNLSKSFNF
ncbi:hypothetical protein [Sorangium sp. So ce406]|uniref:hypothetical protein n=1 Tax=Sorangium sp. So ce406 TaxID=3133311 RepID=UPI003F5C471A